MLTTNENNYAHRPQAQEESRTSIVSIEQRPSCCGAKETEVGGEQFG